MNSYAEPEAFNSWTDKKAGRLAESTLLAFEDDLTMCLLVPKKNKCLLVPKQNKLLLSAACQSDKIGKSDLNLRLVLIWVLQWHLILKWDLRQISVK